MKSFDPLQMLTPIFNKIDSPTLRDSLFNDSELVVFFPRIWHMCTLETRQASLHRIYAVRHVHIA